MHIEIKNLKKTAAKSVLFQDIQLSISTPSIHYLYGKNGVGKTTFFHCLLNLENYSGQIIVSNPEEVSAVFEGNHFYENLSGLNNVRFWTEFRASKEKILDLATKYFKNAKILKQKVNTYSNGQRKKLAILIIEILQPKLILFDEVLNGLDVESRKEFFRFLQELKKEAIIFLTGHEEIYLEFSDHFYLLENERLQSVEPQALKEKFQQIKGVPYEE